MALEELGARDPRQLGVYELVGRLGSGGMGQVFLGRSPGGRLVAVKVIRPDLVEGTDFRKRFAREVAAARQVSGVFTAAVVDADPQAPTPWLVTAFVDGPSLADRVAAEGPFGTAEMVALSRGLAEGLAAVHAAGVVHRDLKPTNVLLAADGPRIIDFGIARAVEATALTGTGTVVGSPGFMSPEQAAGEVAGPASDVFSLGAVLVFAATGRAPFGSGPASSLLYRVVHKEPDLAGVPETLREVVLRCLEKEPAKRPSAGELLVRLGQIAGPDRVLPTPPPSVPDLPSDSIALPGDNVGATKSAVVTPDRAWRYRAWRYRARRDRARSKAWWLAAAGALAGVLVLVVVLVLPGASSGGLPGPTAYVVDFGHHGSEGDTVTPVSLSSGTSGTSVPSGTSGKPITVGKGPSAIAITPDGATAYVADYGNDGNGDTVTPINLRTGTAGQPITVGKGPSAIAITPDGATAYVADYTSNAVTPINLASGKPGPPIAIGMNPIAIAITPNGSTAYVASNGGGVTPIDLATGKAGQVIPSQAGLNAIAISPNGSTAYVAGSNGVLPIDLATNTRGTVINAGNDPDTIAIAPNGSTAYVGDFGDNGSASTVTPINLATGTPGRPIAAGKGPSGIAITADGSTAYVTDWGVNGNGDTVTPINLRTNTPGKPIPVGAGPFWIAIAPK